MRSMRKVSFWMFALIVVALGSSIACTAILGSYEVGSGDSVTPGNEAGSEAGSDSSTTDSSTTDGGADAADAADANIKYTYNDVTERAKWEASPLPSVAPNHSFGGGAFDGRYLYVVPGNNGATGLSIVYRYDTKAAWGTGAGWESFDMTTAAGGAAAKGYYGAIFDGRFVYLTPFYNGGSGHGLIARYDTMRAFTSATSWTFLDIASKGAGFGGAAFVGQHVYFMPTLISGSRIARYDTKAAFTLANVEVFATTDVDALAYAYDGVTFDGKSLYLSPYKGNPCRLLRYDTTRAFALRASWQVFDASALACGLRGATFAGKYVYYAGSYDNGNSGKILRYDTTDSFVANSAYKVYDLTNVDAALVSFAGIVFDGRNIYTVPQGTAGSLIGIYDTTKPFDQAGSWSTFDTLNLNGNAKQFTGGVFDGQYTYFLPSTGANPFAVRFDAKSPSGVPPLWGHSFY